MKLPFNSDIPFLGLYPPNKNNEFEMIYALFIEGLKITAGIWKQPKYPVMTR